MTPLVSICVPNLNTRPYLEERFATVFDQTYGNWELIISDNFSDDGAWEFFKAQAQKDRRISVAQAPRSGMYPNWNNCVRRAHGKYVYVATSDDTMAPDFLEKMVGALEDHPECDLAHSWIKMIGDDATNLQHGWEEGLIFAQSSKSLKGVSHVRKAPFDGLLHLSGATVYTSITQLLIRRTLFDRIGYFENLWGSVGDFNWDMRAALVANTVHVPQTWGGWRIHAKQATSTVDYHSEAHAIRVDDMIDHAIRHCGPLLPPLLADRLSNDWAPFARQMRHLIRESRYIKSAGGRWAYHLKNALAGSRVAWRHSLTRVSRRPVWPESVPIFACGWLSSIGMSELLSPCTVAAATGGQDSLRVQADLGVNGGRPA